MVVASHPFLCFMSDGYSSNSRYPLTPSTNNPRSGTNYRSQTEHIGRASVIVDIRRCVTFQLKEDPLSGAPVW